MMKIKIILWIGLITILFTLNCIGQVSDFNYYRITGQYCLPITIEFNETSSGNPIGFLWNFGNGQKSNKPKPSAIYNSSGTYTVKLISVYQNNASTSIKNIIIPPSFSADFNCSKNILCKPDTISFSIIPSQGIQYYLWDFGDSTNQYNTNSTTINHFFSDYGVYNVTLKAIGIDSCVIVSQKAITIKRPLITGTVSPKNGCIPSNCVFKVNFNSLNNGSILNYLWDFGDGTTSDIISNQNNHTYNNTGNYLANLKINTSEGCAASFYFDSLKFGSVQQVINASANDSIFCGSEKMIFKSTSNLANEFLWDFSGERAISKDSIISHKFLSLGKKKISVIPFYNGCRGFKDSFYINVIGVIANYQFKNTCGDRKTFSFKNLSKGNLSNCNWIFGDGVQYNNCVPISHSYTTEGKYQTKLYVIDLVSGCQDSSSQNIYITNPILNNTDQSICVNQSTEFKLLQNKRNPPSNLSWFVLGNLPVNSKDTIYTIIADSTGIFDNKVIINNGNNYCKDTIFLNHPIKVTGPKVDFIIPNNLCLYDSLKIINLSHSFQQTDSIKYWNWNFGMTSFQEHVFQPIPFTYPEEKTYSIKLVAIDKLGCKDSLIKKVKVHPIPFLWIIPKLSKLCSDQHFTLTGYTSDTITWMSLPNNYCIHCDTLLISLNISKNIIANSINQFGCSTSDSSTIIIIPKFNAVIKNNDTSICMDNAVQLEVSPRNKITKWIPNDFLNNTTIYNPISTPNRNIKYNVILKDSMNCFTSIDSIEIKIFKSPRVDAGVNKTVSFNSVFSFTPSYSNNIKDYLWTPSNKLNCNNCPYPYAIINESTKFTINVTSDSGCKAKDEITIYISCKNANILLPSAFSPNRDNLNDLYRPITRGIKTIKEFLILNKYGQVLYQKQKCIPNDNQTGWDGKYLGKDQEQGAYVYIIKAVCDVGETIIEKGSFLLLR